MIYVARDGESGDIYLVAGDDEDSARAALGDANDSDGDEFAIVPAKLPAGKTVVDITGDLR